MLGEPAGRAAYDAQLIADTRQAASTAPRAAGPGARRTPGGSRPPSFDGRLVDPRLAAAGSGGGHAWRWVGVLAVLAVAALVVTVTAYASHGHPSPSGTSTPGVGAADYPVGACVAVTAGPAALVVPCDQPHTGTVASTTDYPRPCPPGTYTVALVVQDLSLCLTSS